ncbi:MAG: MCE family protein [Bacteroidetes bacterium]|nr:MCE family protein [Bacteroidota bacterium]
MAISTETKVGILAVVSITLLALGFDFLKGNRTFERGRTFYAVYDRVPGLQESDPIKVNDLLVGRVKELTLLPDYKILARFTITEEFDIPTDSRVMISSSDLLGAKQIDLIIGNSRTLARSDDTLRGTIQIGIQEEIREELKPITEKFQSLIAQIDSAVTIVSSIFSENMGNDVESSVHSITASLENFQKMSLRADQLVESQSSSVDSIFGSIETLTGTLASNQANIDRIVNNLATITDSLAAVEFAQTVTEARLAIASLAQIVQTVESGEGTLGKLIMDDALYQSLQSSTNDLDALLLDIQANPGRYVTLLRIGGGNKKQEPKK